MTNETLLHQIWETEQEILDVINQVCSDNGLCYSLAYGSLIGALRHKGFIPWDDDIDLIMPREDYEQLLKIWNKSAPEGYIIQNIHTDPDFTQNFTKIRKDHTTFLQTEDERNLKYHKGIFVDIFPGDRVAPGKLGRKTQYLASAINLLYSRGHTSKNDGVIGLVEKVLLSIPKNWQILYRNLAEKWVRKWNGNSSAQYVFASTLEFSRKYHPSSLFTDMQTIEFNGKVYQCVRDADAMLRSDYGDYLQLPPVNDRTWKHNPILVDFHHNYEELIK